MVRPSLTPNQVRVVGALLGVAGFAVASLSALTVQADTNIPAKTVWVTTNHDNDLPTSSVRTLSCQNDDIDIWAYDLGRSNGEWQIFYDSSTGDSSRNQVMHGSYHFDQDKKNQKQVIAEISISDLVSRLHDEHDDTAQGGFGDGAWHLHAVISDPYKSVKFLLRDNCESEESSPPSPPVVTPPAPSSSHASAPTPAPVAATTTAAPKAAAAVPQTGADVPFLTGLTLMSSGGASLLLAGRMRRRRVS